MSPAGDPARSAAARPGAVRPGAVRPGGDPPTRGAADDALADAALEDAPSADAPSADAPSADGPSVDAAPVDAPSVDAAPVDPGRDGAAEAGDRTGAADRSGTTAVRRLLTPRLRRVDVAVAALLAVLGFAAVIQVRSTQEEGPLAAARQEDLVQILDDLSNRNDRLRAEIAALEQARREITTGTDRSEAALGEARRRTQLLGVLAGTVPAQGPGLRLTITDPGNRMRPEVLLNALEELRAAGAEAVQLEGPVNPGTETAPGQPRVRVVAETSFLPGEQGGVVVDGQLLRAPYRFVVVGDPSTLATALAIRGGVVDDVEQRGGQAVVERRDDVLVGALRTLEEPRYARPAA